VDEITEETGDGYERLNEPEDALAVTTSVTAAGQGPSSLEVAEPRRYIGELAITAVGSHLFSKASNFHIERANLTVINNHLGPKPDTIGE